MAARIAVVLSAVFLGLVLGWVCAPATPATVAAVHPLRLAALQLDPAAPRAADAATALAGAAPRPPGPPGPPRVYARAALPPPPPPMLPPPPPPQADAVLRSSVAAVTEDGGGLSLVLAGGGRRVREGERFMGWTVASVSRSGAVLRRGDARREVSFFAPEPQGVRAGAPLASAPGAVTIPPPRSPAPLPRAPTAAEFFRGFKG